LDFRLEDGDELLDLLEPEADDPPDDEAIELDLQWFDRFDFREEVAEPVDSRDDLDAADLDECLDEDGPLEARDLDLPETPLAFDTGLLMLSLPELELPLLLDALDFELSLDEAEAPDLELELELLLRDDADGDLLGGSGECLDIASERDPFKPVFEVWCVSGAGDFERPFDDMFETSFRGGEAFALWLFILGPEAEPLARFGDSFEPVITGFVIIASRGAESSMSLLVTVFPTARLGETALWDMSMGSCLSWYRVTREFWTSDSYVDCVSS
jgi:hypothetical protein